MGAGAGLQQGGHSGGLCLGGQPQPLGSCGNCLALKVSLHHLSVCGTPAILQTRGRYFVKTKKSALRLARCSPREEKKKLFLKRSLMQKDVPAQSLSSCPGIVDSLSKSIAAPPVSTLGGGGNGKSPEEVTVLESCVFLGCSAPSWLLGRSVGTAQATLRLPWAEHSTQSPLFKPVSYCTES